MHRTTSVPKKISSADQPAIALVEASSVKGQVVLIATCKLQTTFIVTGSNLASYSSNFPMLKSMQAIRKLVSAKPSVSVHCLVLYNVCMKRAESTSHPFECKLRAGWGAANLRTEYQSIAKFVAKAKPPAADVDNRASDVLQSSVESVEPHQPDPCALQEDEPNKVWESHASGSAAREAEADADVEPSDIVTDVPDDDTYTQNYTCNEPPPKRQRVHDININGSEEVEVTRQSHIILVIVG